jgi:hypothetical protein
MNLSISGWVILTRKPVAGSHPQNDKFIARPEEQRCPQARRADRNYHFDSRGSFCVGWMETSLVSETM